MTSPAGISDGPPLRRSSIRSLAIATGLPSWAGSRRTIGVGPLLGQQAGDRPAVVGGDRDRLVTLLDDLRRLEDRLDELGVGSALADRGQVGPEGRRGRIGLLVDVALRASQGRLVEHQGAAAGVAELAGVARQRGRVLAAELLIERGRRCRWNGIIRAGDRCRGQQEQGHEGG